MRCGKRRASIEEASPTRAGRVDAVTSGVVHTGIGAVIDGGLMSGSLVLFDNTTMLSCEGFTQRTSAKTLRAED